MFKTLTFLIIASLGNFKILHCQTIGSWSILNLNYGINSKFNIQSETQLRSLQYYKSFHYFESKAVVTYSGYKDILFALGFGKYSTYSEGGTFVEPLKSDEWRIWPQLITIQQWNQLKLEHRYRYEARIYTNGNFKNRFRYRLNLVYPLLKKIKLQTSSELFFSPYEPYFERLRLASGLVYKHSSLISIFTGYLYQIDYKIFDETGKHFTQFGIYFNLNKQ
jgi:hypothetical protein